MKKIGEKYCAEVMDGFFFPLEDKTKLFIYEYIPEEVYHSSIFIFASLFGSNHRIKTDLIEQLSGGKRRIVYIHPRGTGLSDGIRGDREDFSTIYSDVTAVLTAYQKSDNKPSYMYAESIAVPFLHEYLTKNPPIKGAIYSEPVFYLKSKNTFKTHFYSLFQKHKVKFLIADSFPELQSILSGKEGKMTINRYSMYIINSIKKVLVRKNTELHYPVLVLQNVKVNINNHSQIKDNELVDLKFVEDRIAPLIDEWEQKLN